MVAGKGPQTRFQTKDCVVVVYIVRLLHDAKIVFSLIKCCY